jgi:hypothetical protein
MEGFSKDLVIQGIQNLYHSNCEYLRGYSDCFLKEFQKSPWSWEICIEILQNDLLDEEIYLFSAITLKKKLVFDFEELEQRNKVELKVAILRICWKFRDFFKVLRQVALCVGLLAIHLAFEWGESVLSDLEKIFVNNSSGLLMMIEGLADELHDKETVVNHSKVIFLKEKLKPHLPQVFELILRPENNNSLAIRVFISWAQLDFCYFFPRIEKSQLFASVFQMVLDREGFDQGFQALNKIINLSENQSNPSLTQAIIKNLEGIWPQVKKKCCDLWISQHFVRVYCNFSGIHVKKWLETGNFKFFWIILELFEKKQKDLVEDITRFWHRTLKVATRSLNEGKKLEGFDQVVESLLKICVNHFRITSKELETGINQDSQEIRENLEILLENISDFFTPSKVSTLILNELNILLSCQITEIKTYIEIEALVACLPSLLILNEETFFHSSFSEFLERLTSIPFQFHQLNISIMKTVSSVPHHLSANILFQSLNFLYTCFEQGLSIDKFSNVFKKICEINSLMLTQNCSMIKRIYLASLSLLSPSADVILEATCMIFWQSSDSQDISFLVNSFFQGLRSDEEETLIHAVDKLGIVFKSAYLMKSVKVDKVLQVFLQIWPELLGFFRFFSKSLDESVCRVINNSVKKLGASFEVFLNDLIEVIRFYYPKSLSSAFLYTAENLIKYMPQRLLLKTEFLQLFDSISTVTIFSFKKELNLTLCPEIVEDFYGMCEKFLRVFLDDLMFREGFLEILEYSNFSIGISETQAGRCLYGFLQCTFGIVVDSLQSCENDSKSKILSSIFQKFQSTLNLLLKCLIQVVPSALFDSIQSLTSLILSSHASYDWLKLSIDLIPHDCLTTEEKSLFLSNVLNGQDLDSWVKKLYKRSKRRALRKC